MCSLIVFLIILIIVLGQWVISKWDNYFTITFVNIGKDFNLEGVKPELRFTFKRRDENGFRTIKIKLPFKFLYDKKSKKILK